MTIAYQGGNTRWHIAHQCLKTAAAPMSSAATRADWTIDAIIAIGGEGPVLWPSGSRTQD